MTTFSISGFTHPGTIRQTNEDVASINGFVFNEGDVHLIQQKQALCFVADGVGGNNAGEFAANYVLRNITKNEYNLLKGDSSMFHTINQSLINATNSDSNLRGSATTITGLVAYDKSIRVFHAGDSSLWLYRNEMMFQVTEDQVLDPLVKNSPLVSYFGGEHDQLKLETNFPNLELMDNDIYLICSDGLFKSIHQKECAKILQEHLSLADKAVMLFQGCFRSGMPDNVSVILVQPSQ